MLLYFTDLEGTHKKTGKLSRAQTSGLFLIFGQDFLQFMLISLKIGLLS